MSKKQFKTFGNSIPEKKEEIKEEPKIIEPKFSLNEYLSKYHNPRTLDKIIRKWYLKRDITNPKKSISEWDSLMSVFHNETEV